MALSHKLCELDGQTPSTTLDSSTVLLRWLPNIFFKLYILILKFNLFFWDILLAPINYVCFIEVPATS
jgi:hypothetical protein